MSDPITTGTLHDPTLGARAFVDRHIGPDDAAIAEMLKVVGFESLDALMEARSRPDPGDRGAEPARGRVRGGRSAELRALAGRNVPGSSMIGLGYHGTITRE